MAFIAGPPKLLLWRPSEGIPLDVIMQDGSAPVKTVAALRGFLAWEDDGEVRPVLTRKELHQQVRVRRDKPPELDTIIGPARQHHPYSA